MKRMEMTEAEAFDYVTRWADAMTEPAALTEGEILDLLDACRLADSAGHAPADPDWVPTYWLPRAVQMALELRALRAGAQVDVTIDGMSIKGSQLAAALERQAASWRARCSMSVPSA